MGLREERGPGFNWQEYHYHYAQGILHGFPECCVETWSWNRAYGYHNQAELRGVVPNDDNPYVPCDRCAKKRGIKGWSTERSVA